MEFTVQYISVDDNNIARVTLIGKRVGFFKMFRCVAEAMQRAMNHGYVVADEIERYGQVMFRRFYKDNGETGNAIVAVSMI